MYKLFLTVRYLTRRPLSLVAILVLSLAIAVLVIAPSVMSGFQEEFHKRLRGAYSDVSLWSSRPFSFPEDSEIEDYLLGLPHVKAVAPYLENPALDKHLNKVDYCFLRGLDPLKEATVSDFNKIFLSERERFLRMENPDALPDEEAKAIREAAEELKDEPDLKKIYHELEHGSDELPGVPTVAAGIHYLIRWQLEVGDTVRLTTASDAGEVSKDKKFLIVAGFSTGRHEFDRRLLIMSVPALQDLVGVSGRVTGYSIRLDDYNNASVAKGRLRDDIRNPNVRTPLKRHEMSGFYIKTWEERNSNLLKAVAMEKLLIRLITLLIVASAAASIFLVLFMTVHSKVREIGILRAVGATRSGVLVLFITQGLLIAVVSLVLGTLLGQAVGANINEIADVIHQISGWHPFPPEVYYLEKIPFKYEWQDQLINFAATLFLGGALAFYPSLLAALKPPLRAIRYE
jgi:lipoprotein-releasing system permease protein